MVNLLNQIRLVVAEALLGNDQIGDLVPDDPNDPEGVELAVYNARMNEITPVYPCVTYRISQGLPDARFRSPAPLSSDEEPDESYKPRILDFYVEIEVWDQAPNADRIDQIAAVIDDWFESRAFVFTGGRVFRAEMLALLPDRYDKDLNARFALMRYRLRVARA